MEGAEAGSVSTVPRHGKKRNPQLTGPRATRGSEDRATKGLKVMQYWRLPATECADKAAPRNHHSRKTLATGYPETGKPRPHSRMTEASALEGQPRRGREYADMQVPKYPHIGSLVSIHVPLTRYDAPKRSHHHSLMFPCWQVSDPGGLD